MTKHPSITFLFPYRWLIEDKSFFPQNVRKQIESRVGGKEELSVLEEIVKYRIVILCRYHKMIRVPVTKAVVEKALKSVFPNAKCISLDIDYQMSQSKTSLPMLDFQVFF